MRAVIIGGGSVSENLKEYILPGDFIVCADSGYDRARAFGVKPNLVIGDMASIVSKLESGPEIITAPVQKDETDSMLCIDILIDRGFDEILFFGALGGRPDHSFANITSLLYAAKKGIHIHYSISCGNIQVTVALWVRRSTKNRPSKEERLFLLRESGGLWCSTQERKIHT